MRIIPASILLCAALALAVSVSASAEQPVTPSDSEFVETATVIARAPESSTSSVTVFDRDDIEELNVRSVTELMRFIPGLDVTSGGPRGAPALAKIRGGDPNFTVVLLDGVPLNDLTDQFGGIVDLNSLPVTFVDRIEIVRAPLSSLFGSTGLAGAINIITRRGQADGARTGFELSAGDASSLETAISQSGVHGTTDYFVGAWYVQEEERVADDSFEQTGVQGNVAFDVGSRSRLRITGRATSWEGRDYPDASGGPLLGSGETRFSEHDEVNISADWSFGKPQQSHRVRATYYRHELERASPGIDGPFFDVPATVESTEFSNTTLAWSYPVLKRDKSTLSVGAELDLERGDNTSTLDFGGPVDGSYRIDRSTAGAFVEYVADLDSLSFEIGARADFPEGFDTELGLRAGLVYPLPSEKTRLRFSAGRSYKLPSFRALASPAALGGNPGLEPEESVGGDLGVEQRFDSAGVRLTFNLFAYRFENLIDFDFGTFQNLNLAEVRTRGAELEADWSLPLGVSVKANVTRQSVDNRKSTEELRQRPEWIGGTRIVWRPLDSVTIEADAQFVAGSFDEQLPSPRTTTGGYQLYGASTAFGISREWQAFARIDNLADKEYETLIGFSGAGRSFHVGLRRRLE